MRLEVLERAAVGEHVAVVVCGRSRLHGSCSVRHRCCGPWVSRWPGTSRAGPAVVGQAPVAVLGDVPPPFAVAHVAGRDAGGQRPDGVLLHRRCRACRRGRRSSPRWSAPAAAIFSKAPTMSCGSVRSSRRPGRWPARAARSRPRRWRGRTARSSSPADELVLQRGRVHDQRAPVPASAVAIAAPVPLLVVHGGVLREGGLEGRVIRTGQARVGHVAGADDGQRGGVVGVGRRGQRNGQCGGHDGQGSARD